MMEFKPTAYTLQSCASKREFADSGWMLADKEDSSPAFVRAIYQNKQINFKDNSYGIYKFADWLPIHKMLEGSCAPVTYKSEGLANKLGLSNLYITFSGWWPEKGATMQTCSFKETEAYSVCARLPKDNDKILVVASAGNTARAFAKVCSENNIPIVIAIPYDNLNALWFKEPLNDCVKIICSPANTDYFDAIALAAKLNSSSKFIEEGGAKNVARRDGMGTTVLSAAEHIGRIPDSYFQAIGSGTGTIAAYEANLRLMEDGRFGNHLMKLIPSQNLPFVPMYDAWKADSRALLIADEDKAREDALKITAKVLSNRKPPYGIVGGLYDCLKATDGDIEVVTNEELDNACKLFEEIEGSDIHPAAGVAVCSLIKAVESGKVSKDEVIMLNITGGGEKRFKNEHKCIEVKPHLVIDAATSAEDVCAAVEGLFK
ncbi:MAG: cysteate synthase [Bacteroidales bacterium]|nr:cysteate synthase [Bacteroidales bacterium]MBQ5593788.1 cysteate synthase [Bacteroidales bacterium]MBQ5784784.1 cysteate synthase [Bacteroidales bacterium]MBR6540624.1 cysteate synthase [Bacteroidales bacterium]